MSSTTQRQPASGPPARRPGLPGPHSVARNRLAAASRKRAPLSQSYIRKPAHAANQAAHLQNGQPREHLRSGQAARCDDLVELASPLSISEHAYQHEQCRPSPRCRDKCISMRRVFSAVRQTYCSATPVPASHQSGTRPRLNDGAVDAVAASIRQFGFRQAIVVDAQGVIICGHTRWKAARSWA